MEKRKRLSKAYGLKSAIAINNEVYFTSFGSGNDSIIVRKLDQEKNVIEISPESKFNIEYKPVEEELNLLYKNYNVSINNPLDNNVVGMDYLEAKEVLEKRMFDGTFNDNIHIQIAYNVLDITKLLSIYFYNIIYSFNNLQRKELSEADNDLIGSLRPEYSLEVADENHVKRFGTFKSRITPYFDFYGKIFKIYKENPDEADNHNYNVLRLLALARNLLAYTGSDLYSLDAELQSAPELKKTLDRLFEEDYRSINQDFNKNAKKNLYAILEILGINSDNKKTVEDIFEDYYRFAIFKESKNIGVNIKKIREFIYELNQFNGNISDHKHDSYRPKINTVMDFLIYKYVHIDNPSIELNFVNELRETLSDKEKESKYREYAKIIFKKLARKYYGFINLAYIVKNAAIMNVKRIELNFEKQIRKISRIDRISTFTKFIYFISKFLEPKEINELYSSLINKMDNINGLIAVGGKLLDQPIKFTDNYSLFNGNAGKFAAELRICRSISKMKPDMNNIKKTLYKDALAILDVRDEIFENEKLLDETLDEFLKKEKGDKQFRNFIVNNVIKSKKFEMVVKYMNPKQCIKFVKSDVVLNFVLGQLPEEQIIRYHKSCFGEINCDVAAKRVDLRDAIRDLNFDKVKGQEQLIIDASNQHKSKPVEYERLKSLIGLYLTVIYLVVKNLVKINSVHIIAMQCFERDNELFFPTANKDHLNGEQSLQLLNRMISLNKYNEHALKYINENIGYYNRIPENVFHIYRNRVMHLNFISNAYKYLDLRKMESYYDLYQYIVQCDLMNKINKSTDTWERYRNDIKEFDFYSKDMTKIINIPFAYNLARYKNLTIGDLYNDNYKRNKKEKKK